MIKPTQSNFFYSAAHFALKWTPRIIFVGIGGYYSLGVAYQFGIMAAIDKVAIKVLKHWVGYAGIGAVMPTFQSRAAWVVRGVSAAGAGLIYDSTERIVKYGVRKIYCKPIKPQGQGPLTTQV